MGRYLQDAVMTLIAFTINQKMLLLVMARFGHEDGKSVTCGRDRMVDLGRMSKREVVRTIPELVEIGVITTRRRYEGRKRLTDEVTSILPKLFEYKHYCNTKGCAICETYNKQVPVGHLPKTQVGAKYVSQVGATQSPEAVLLPAKQQDNYIAPQVALPVLSLLTRQAVDAFANGWHDLYKADYHVTRSEAKELGGLAQEHGLDKVTLWLSRFFKATDRFFLDRRHSARSFTGSLPQWAVDRLQTTPRQGFFDRGETERPQREPSRESKAKYQKILAGIGKASA